MHPILLVQAFSLHILAELADTPSGARVDALIADMMEACSKALDFLRFYI